MTEDNREPTPDEPAEPARPVWSDTTPAQAAGPATPTAPAAPAGPAGHQPSSGYAAPTSHEALTGYERPPGYGRPMSDPAAADRASGAGGPAASGDPAEPVAPARSDDPATFGTPAAPGPPGAQETPAGQGAPGERVLFGSAFAGHQGGFGMPPSSSGAYPPMGPPIGGPPTEAPQQPRKGHSALVAGLTVLALLVGGGAGAAGGYLVAEHNQADGPVANALDQPKPAEQTTNAPAGSVVAVAEKVLPSVVQLQVRGRSSAGEGSGFVISSDGLIVTNNHVVEVAAKGGEIVAVFHDGSTAPAEIVGRDPQSDVAVVRAQGKTGLPIVDLGRSDDLRVGEGVVAIGSPFELSGTVTSGIVSSLHRPTRAGGENGSQSTVMDAIQTDAAINPGNSGGPLVNMQGQVIGINSAIYNPSSNGSLGIGFAIPIDQARRTADEIVETGQATQTVLGVTVRDNQEGGALIVDVTPNSPAAKAGIKSGDVVTKVDDRKIDTSDALVAAVRSYAPGDKVRLGLGNGSRTVDATLAGQPVETE